MAEPARKLPEEDQADIKPDKPQLRALEGGGETTPRESGHLHDASEKKASSKELEQAENSAGEEKNPDKPEEGLYREESDDERSTLSRAGAVFTKKKVIAGGVVTLLVGGAIGIGSFASGPAQFVQISQLLQRFHFAPIEDNGDSRMLKMYKYGKQFMNGTAENTRLGAVSKRVVPKLDERFAEAGITKDYTTAGTYKGTVIDMEKFTENAKNGETFKGLTTEEQVAKFKKDLNISVTIQEDGTFRTEDTNLWNYFKNRRINRMAAEESGLGRITGSMSARIMGARDGATWHPIKSADGYLTGKLDDFLSWLKGLKDRIRNGEPKTASANGEEKKNQNGDPDEEGTRNSKEGADATNEGSKAAGEIVGEDPALESAPQDAVGAGDGYIKRITTSTGGKLALGATAIIGIACAIKGIADAADALKHDLVILPLIRMGVMAMSLGNQVMNGGDLDQQQLGFFMKQLNNPKTGSWAAARSIQAETGKGLTGPDMPDSANPGKVGKNMFSQVLDGIPGLGPICSAAGSAIGGTVLMVIGAVTAPLSTIIQTLITSSDQFKALIGQVVRWMAGSPIPSFTSGAEYGNFINYGARLAANDTGAGLGGIAMTSQESAQIKQFQMAAQRDDFAHQSFAERVFNPNSPDSLIGKAIDNTSSSTTYNIANIFGSIINPTKLFASFGAFFSRNASADPITPYDYGFPVYGFNLDELQSDTYDNPAENAELVMNILAGPNGATYITKAKKCFGSTLSTDGSIKTDFSKTAIDVNSPDYQKLGCDDHGVEWTRIRFYILDTKTAESADCFDSGDVQSCKDIGFGLPSGPNGSAEGAVPGGARTASQATSPNIYMLGDSLTQGINSSNVTGVLAAQGWSTTVMAECGRHLASDGSTCSPNAVLSGLNQVDQPADQAAIKAAGVVIIGLGTNDPGSPTFADDVTALISKIKSVNPNVIIYWTNLYSTNENADTYKAMDVTLGSLSGSLGFNVIDWATEAQKINAYSPDTFHPNDYSGMANLISTTLGKAP